MPKYRYPLTNGKSLVLTGEAEPTDADVEAAARDAGVEQLLVGATPPEPPVTSPAQPSASDSALPMPGILTATGMAISGAGRAIPATLRTAGKAITKAAPVARMLGGGLGAHFGAAAAGPFPFLGASMGAEAGRNLTRTFERPVMALGDLVKKLGTREFVSKGAGRLVYPARGVLSTLGKRVLPGIGQALTVADAANTGWQGGRWLDELTGNKLSDTVSRLPGAAMGGNLLAALIPDALQRELLKRSQ